MPKPNIHRLIEFQQLILKFHKIERTVRHPDNFERHETDTEHSYTLAMAAWFLTQYFPKLDKPTVIQLALVHDLLEVHAGDTFAFAEQKVLHGKAERETAAIKQLATDWADFPEMLQAIMGYEGRQTEEAKFVYALDKLMPILLNYLTEGRSWKEHGVAFKRFVEEKEAKIPISPEVYEYYKEIVAMLEAHPDFFAPEP
jgi:putative hydrolases of HD superfamily